jgi:hypothetical protein
MGRSFIFPGDKTDWGGTVITAPLCRRGPIPGAAGAPMRRAPPASPVMRRASPIDTNPKQMTGTLDAHAALDVLPHATHNIQT